METSAGTSATKRRHRSPHYPAFDLETTLTRAKELFEVAGRHGTPFSAALTAWGFSPKSSNGSTTLAALKRFGLATDEGKGQRRMITLTPLGHELVFYSSEPESNEWISRAQQAALKPQIHADLWSKYKGDLPQDSVISPYLVFDLGFGEVAAKELLREFRKTIEFANLTPAVSVDSLSANEDENAADAKSEPKMSAPATIASDKPAATPGSGGQGSSAVAPSPKASGTRPQRTIQIPYSPSGWALLQAEFPMSEAAWAQMLSVLEAMKPSLVVSDDE